MLKLLGRASWIPVCTPKKLNVIKFQGRKNDNKVLSIIFFAVIRTLIYSMDVNITRYIHNKIAYNFDLIHGMGNTTTFPVALFVSM